MLRSALPSVAGISAALFSISDVTWALEWPVPEPDRIVASVAPVSVEEARFWTEKGNGPR